MSLTYSTERAVEFLQRFYEGSSPCVFRIGVNEGGLYACSGTWDEIYQFIEAAQGQQNIYFSVNEPNKVISGAHKPAKEDIGRARWLHVDGDATLGETVEDAKARLRGQFAASAQPPTLQIDSGNGIQAFWGLTDAYTINDEHDVAQIEGRNRHLEILYKADHCHNIDRIMRVPWTVNLPNRRKRLKGRVPVVAKLLEFEPKRVYALESFKQIEGGPVEAEIIQFKAIPAKVDIDQIAEISEHVRQIIRFGDDPTKPGRWRSRSEVLYHVTFQCLKRGVSRETVVSILTDPAYRISESILEKKKSVEYAMRQVRRAEERGGFANKPPIEVQAGNVEDCLDRAEAAILSAGIEIFQMNSQLVRVFKDGADSALSITPLDPHWLLEKFTTYASWSKFAGKEIKPFEPKVIYALHYMARKGEWRLPTLKGIIQTPTLRKDYSLLVEPGYDEASGLYFDPGSVKFPAIPEAPTKEDARRALDFVIKPFRCFPFVPDDAADDWEPGENPGLVPSAARSVFISSMLTGILRRSMRTAPMHIFDSPAAGTGKTMLVDANAVILTGAPAVMTTMGDDEVEDRKKLFSALGTGRPLLAIDNVSRPIEGDALCTILTQPIWEDRVLGKSQMATVNTNCLTLLTGNNATPRGDMTRRVVVCRLDSRDPNPESREFSFNPVDMVKENRVEIVVALLTILRAYTCSNEKINLPPMGSFEDWSVVREALVWLDQPDPETTRGLAQKEDPARAMFTEIANYWWELFQDHDTRFSSAISAIQQQDVNESQMALRDLLSALCPNGKLNIRTLGAWFKNNSNRIVNGYRFIRHDDPEKGTILKLESRIARAAPEEWKG